MNVEASGEAVHIALSTKEARLLRWALERALFIDTPANEQPAIAALASRLLEALAPSGAPSKPQ